MANPLQMNYTDDEKFEIIVQACCRHMNISRDSVSKKGATKPVSYAKQFIAYLVKKNTSYAPKDIAGKLGCWKNDADVIYAIDRFTGFVKLYSETREHVKAVAELVLNEKNIELQK